MVPAAVVSETPASSTAAPDPVTPRPAPTAETSDTREGAHGPGKAQERQRRESATDATTAPAQRASPARRPASRRRRRVSDEVRLQLVVKLPEDLLTGLRSQLRPIHTGAPRSLSATLLVEAAAEVLFEDLAIDVDVQGLTAGDRELARERVRAAVEARFAELAT